MRHRAAQAPRFPVGPSNPEASDDWDESLSDAECRRHGRKDFNGSCAASETYLGAEYLASTSGRLLVVLAQPRKALPA